jgi:hypothetical protein
MTGIQITLLVLGGVIFIVSFFLPAGKKDRNIEQDIALLTDDQVKLMVEKEIDESKSNINDIVDETITYAMEKGERAMERISNEKMMAINEYSDTVLKEIHKNQQEVVFLYDMLNDKHTALLSTVNQATLATSEMKQAQAADENEAEETKETKAFQLFAPQKIQADDLRILNKSYPDLQEIAEAEVKSGKERMAANAVNGNMNNNNIILEMHKEGKPDIAIARSLGLGISEVKLVIDLFDGDSI